MKEIIIGTKNKAKINQISVALAPVKIVVKALPADKNLPQTDEGGKTAQANARKKALTYAKSLGKPVLSTDHSLYLDGLPDSQQPGLNTRRINGRDDRSTDEEMLDYYSNLIKQLGGKVTGQWEFAYCFAWPDGKMKELTVVSPRAFVSKSSKKIIAGFPLESLQIDAASGKYISEMTQAEQDVFWQKTIGRQLCEFVVRDYRIFVIESIFPG